MELEFSFPLLAIGATLFLLVSGAVVAWLRKRVKRQKGKAAAIRHTLPSQDVGFGLAPTRRGMWARLLANDGQESLLGLVEEALLAADVGVGQTRKILEYLSANGAAALRDRETLRYHLGRILRDLLAVSGSPSPSAEKPHVVFLVGVNGVGKTTTVAKLAHWFQKRGRRVLVVGGDTFRAAAMEQLEVWAQRLGVDFVRQKTGADPGAVVFDGLQAALARGVDVAVVDTAGRLHEKKNLMEELRKLARIAQRVIPSAPHEVFLVVDATVGQNGLRQARTFAEAVPLTGVILTKLDGTARGGIALSIVAELGLPIRFVGCGEKIEDFEEFNPDRFVESLLWGEGERARAASAA
jgi:fused signal recognition particle receptor